MTQRNLHQDMTEAERRISNLAMMGQVVALDAARARVRVQAGPITTGWLPFACARAGEDRSWHPPEPGEQVVLLAPGGDLNQAVVVGSVYRADHPAPADSADISRTTFRDGAVMEYDREQHHWRLSVPAGGHIRFEIGDTSLELTSEGSTLTTPKLLVDAPESTFTGKALIQGLLTYLAGLTGKGKGGGAGASIEGHVQVSRGDVTADAVSLKGHSHTEQGDGASTSAAQ